MTTQKGGLFRVVAAFLVAAMVMVAGGASASAAVASESERAVEVAESKRSTDRRSLAKLSRISITDEQAEKWMEETGDGTLELETGGEIRIDPLPVDGQVEAQFSVGIGRGLYIYLTPSEQRAILTGGVAALTAAICRNALVINVIGAVGCAGVVAGVLWLAKDWLERNRVCGHRLEVKIGGSTKRLANLKCI